MKSEINLPHKLYATKSYTVTCKGRATHLIQSSLAKREKSQIPRVMMTI